MVVQAIWRSGCGCTIRPIFHWSMLKCPWYDSARGFRQRATHLRLHPDCLHVCLTAHRGRLVAESMGKCKPMITFFRPVFHNSSRAPDANLVTSCFGFVKLTMQVIMQLPFTSVSQWGQANRPPCPSHYYFHIVLHTSLDPPRSPVTSRPLTIHPLTDPDPGHSKTMRPLV